ncbi:MAG: hypothetical protein JNL58_01935 [Planctomyces sp.]|nr:hypothetical protein [Planctomyces sp.]
MGPERSTILSELRRQLAKSQPVMSENACTPSGLLALDRLLPGGGFSGSTIVEWVQHAPGLPVATTALRCLAPMLAKPGCIAVVDGQNEFHAEAALRQGIPAARLLLIRPPSGRGSSHQADFLWALEQATRCSGIRAVLCWIDRISSTAMRRLQLAVERSGVSLHMVRPHSALKQPSWADLRFFVRLSDRQHQQKLLAGNQRFILVELLRSRNAVHHQGHALLKIDYETGHVCTVPELADSAAPATAQAATTTSAARTTTAGATAAGATTRAAAAG